MSDFWDVLARLNSSYGPHIQGQQHIQVKKHSTSQGNFPESAITSAFQSSHSLDDSPFGRLLNIVTTENASQSETAVDNLLRLILQVINFLPSVNENVQNVLPEWEKAMKSRRTLNGSENVCLLPGMKQLVEIVTRRKFSNECLEQGRGILLRAAQVFGNSTRDTIFEALLDAAVFLGEDLKQQLIKLRQAIAELRATTLTSSSSGVDLINSAEKSQQSSPVLPLPNRANQKKAVIQNASNKELQLPAMNDLTTKASIQHCLLRTLNTLITLRDSVDVTKDNVGKKSNNIKSSSNSTQIINVNNTEKMDIDEDAKKKILNFDFEAPLSRYLPLDELWSVLGDCLNRLSESNDPHIVLVLQPAVEAFFLVHAARRKERARPSRTSIEQQQQQQQPPTISENVLTEQPNAGVALDSMSASSPSDHQLQPPPPQQQQQQQLIGTQDQSISAVSTTPQSSSNNTTTLHTIGIDSGSATPGTSLQTQISMTEDVRKFVKFAEEHRNVLNQILRQSNDHLADGPFAVLVDHTRVLDFDVKRRYFRKELERSDNIYRREDIPVRIRRDHIFQDSFRELFRLRSNEWKNRFYIIFEGEEGQDAGGLLREWYSIITREIFNPDYALFQTAPGDRVTYMINASSYINVEHLDYFKFVGRLIAKAIYDNKLLDCYFTRAFYKHILGKQVKYNDLESEDPSFYQSLVYLLENPVDELLSDLTFSLEVTEFGKYEIRELKPTGQSIPVTEENKQEYVKLVCRMKMTGAIRKQLDAFLTGFYDIIPRDLIGIFNEQELELLISGLPNIDVDDLQANTEYNKYTKTSLQIQWFWRALRSFDQADRAKFLQFVTGTSKVPLQGFSALEGMHGIQRFQIHRDDRSTDRLPAAHTCFNQLDLPPYETYDKLRDSLLTAIRECTEGFGFA